MSFTRIVVATWFSLLIMLVGLSSRVSVAQAICKTLQDEEYTVTVCRNAPAVTPSPTSTAAVPTATPFPSPTATATPASTATATTVPTPTPTESGSGQQSLEGIWISRSELSALPRSGAAWSDVLSNASKTCTPDLSNQDDNCNMVILAKAYVYGATGDASYRSQVVTALNVVTNGNTESGGRTLALGRELAAYVIAADIIDLKTANSSLDVVFRAKLRELLTKTLDGKTLVSCHEVRPNNWGTMCGGSRAAVAVYLGDKATLDRVATVFRGYLGDRGAYSSFDYGDLSWQCDSQAPVGVNPVGCVKQGFNIDGALPEEMRRGGGFKNPPSETGYAWEAMQGVIVQAEILHRAGYPAWTWSSNAICRAETFLMNIGWSPSGDDMWQTPILNARCPAKYGVSGLGSPGKIMAYGAWTHGATMSPDVAAEAVPDLAGSERKIVADSDQVSLIQEIEALKEFGWRPVGDIETSVDAEGANIYLQEMEK